MLTKSTKNYDYLPDYIKCVNLGEFSLTKELASSKIIIDNGTGLSYLHYKKKRNQYLIQTWHGSIGIKKFSKETNSDVRWIKKAEKEAKMTDFIISNSTFETEQVYKATFWKNTPIWEYGHPRNDILFQKTDTKLKELFYNKYNISISNKLCLYAPTFRDTKSFEYYNIDYKAVKEALNKKFGGEFTIITRFHLHLRSLLSSQKLDNNTIDVSDYPDIMEILTFIDCGITDYSSWICEYMLSRKPGFLYAPDLEEYQTNERAFFYPLSDLPFPCSTSNEQLIRNIELFDEITFKNKCDSFLNIMKCFDDGKASDRTATSILELLAK